MPCATVLSTLSAAWVHGGPNPIPMSLVLKGLSPGTAFVLLMAGPAVNFASLTLISREMGRRAAMVYISSIVAGALAFGLAIDYLLPAQWFALPHAAAAHAHHAAGAGWFQLVCSAVLVTLLAVALVKSFVTNHKHQTINDMTKTYTIKGMNCQHCRAAVAKSIEGVEGVEKVDVNLLTGIATVDGTHSPEAVVEAVRAAGFDARES